LRAVRRHAEPSGRLQVVGSGGGKVDLVAELLELTDDPVLALVRVLTPRVIVAAKVVGWPPAMAW